MSEVNAASSESSVAIVGHHAARQSATPMVFLSHDTRDADLAEAFAKLLGSVSCGMLRTFRSSDKKGTSGIEYGLEWYPQLMNRLAESTDVVCLLTPRSLGRPWILFEAGVAKGTHIAVVHGVAFGISLAEANTGPFAQFQNCDGDRDSLTKLVMQLLARIPNSNPEREAVQLQVDAFLTRKEQILRVPVEEEAREDQAEEASAARLFEEVKLMFQDLPSRVQSRISDALDGSRNRSIASRMHDAYIEDVMFLSERRGSPVGLLVMAGIYREDFPWLYDSAVHLFQAMVDRSERRTERALEAFHTAVEMSQELTALDKRSSKRSVAHLREMHYVAERYADTFSARRRKMRDEEAQEESPPSEA